MVCGNPKWLRPVLIKKYGGFAAEGIHIKHQLLQEQMEKVAQYVQVKKY